MKIKVRHRCSDSMEYQQRLLCRHSLLSYEETLALIIQAQKDLAEEIKIIKEKEIVEDDEMSDASPGCRTFGVSAAMNELLVHNQKLVVTIAKKAYKSLPVEIKVTADFWDVVQIGTLGLRRAILKFDPGRKCKLSTYAAFWIRQAIIRTTYLQNFRVMRAPVYVRQLHGLLVKFLAKAKSAGIESDQPLRFFGGMTLSQIKERVTIRDMTVSWEDRVSYYTHRSDVPELTYKDIISDSRVKFYDDDINEAEARGILKKLFSAANLSDNELKIIFERFGICHRSRTLNEIGQDFGVSRERVRQVEEVALEKLRCAYQMVFGIPLARNEENQSMKQRRASGTKQERILGLTAILERVQLLKNAKGELFLKALNKTPQQAKLLLARG